VTRFGQTRPIRAVDLPDGAWWQDVDTPADLLRARRLIRRSLTKDSDGPVSRYLNRPISTRITMAIAPLRISPDVLSVLFFLVGVWAAWSLSAGRAVVGGLLLQAASILDGVDGETARLLKITTERGAMLDALVDRMVDAAVFAGVSLWLWTDPSRLFRAMIISMSALGWAAIALTARKRWWAVSAMEQPPEVERRLGLLLGGRDGRLFVMAGLAFVDLPGLALAAGILSYASNILIRAVLLLPGLRVRSASVPAVSPPQGVGQASDGDLEEVG